MASGFLGNTTKMHFANHPGINECSLYRTICLIIHITKLMIGIPMKRPRSRIKPEIGQVPCAFETRNTIIYHLNDNRESDTNAEGCALVFVAYVNAFNKVQHQDLFELLGKRGLFGKDVRMMQN